MATGIDRNFPLKGSLVAASLLIIAVGALPGAGHADIGFRGNHDPVHSTVFGFHGSHRGAHGHRHGHTISPHDFNVISRGPLGFELHESLRHHQSRKHSRHSGIHGYHSGCHAVYKRAYSGGHPVTVTGTMCYDQHGYPYIVPNSRRLLEYHE